MKKYMITGKQRNGKENRNTEKLGTNKLKKGMGKP
jgi:hypothetical protein